MTTIDDKLELLQECTNFIKNIKGGSKTNNDTSYTQYIFLILVLFILAFIFINQIKKEEPIATISLNKSSEISLPNSIWVNDIKNNKNSVDYMNYINSIL
jgi:hypothetical protein